MSRQPLARVATSSYLVCMRVVGIKLLKNKLSEYIRLAASGEEILVTDRDRVVAELVPPRLDRAVRPADAFLAQAVREGRIRPAVARTGQPPPSLPIAPTAEILSALAADRGDR